MSNTASKSGGIGFCGMLTILFIGLKLGNVINWSWWLVLAPLWIPFSVVIFLLLAIWGFAIFAATRSPRRY